MISSHPNSSGCCLPCRRSSRSTCCPQAQEAPAIRYTTLELVKKAMGKACGAPAPAAGDPVRRARRDAHRDRAAERVDHAAPHHETVILAIDVSGSMRAERRCTFVGIEAAQAAARAFIARNPRSTRIGIVAFAGSAAWCTPTSNRHDLRARSTTPAPAAPARGQRHPGFAQGSLSADEFDLPNAGNLAPQASHLAPSR